LVSLASFVSESERGKERPKERRRERGERKVFLPRLSFRDKVWDWATEKKLFSVLRTQEKGISTLSFAVTSQTLLIAREKREKRERREQREREREREKGWK